MIAFKYDTFQNINFVTKLFSIAQVQMYLYKPSDKSTSEPVDFWYMTSVAKEENRSPRPGNRRARHDNNQNEPSSGTFISLNKNKYNFSIFQNYFF